MITECAPLFPPPRLYHTVVRPLQTVKVIADPTAFQGKRAVPCQLFSEVLHQPLTSNEGFVADFGNHFVGKVTVSLGVEGIQDSPCRLAFRFAEIAPELAYSMEDYRGWLNSAWFYTETVTVDVLPCTVTLPRRYAFRFLQLTVVGSPMSYRVTVEDLVADTTTSADYDALPPLSAAADAQLQSIDRIALRTLSECMQEVYEDGPKRDRRLWIGDMRLQALANYETFGDTDTVKYCLSLFASQLVDGGFVSPCFYTAPTPHPDAWHFSDYSLFFISCLYDYYRFTNDKELLSRYWKVAYQQATLTATHLFDAQGKLHFKYDFFIDWCPGLQKKVSALSVILFTFKQALFLAEEQKDIAAQAFLTRRISQYTDLLLTYYDPDLGCFVSEGQISLCSQAWAVLADVLPKAQLRHAMEVGETRSETRKETTPYMKHILLEAYWKLGEKEKTMALIRSYWGAMADYGADTFFELFSREDHFFTTAQDGTGYMLNSYCHAWSCTPCIFIRRYFQEQENI